MGYDLHITRKPHWANEEGSYITLEEWLSLVQDAELTIDEQNGPYFAVWLGPGEYACWIHYYEDDLFSNHPTDGFIEKMVQLARQLGGRVQGDDGEIYPGGGQEPYQE